MGDSTVIELLSGSIPEKPLEIRLRFKPWAQMMKDVGKKMGIKLQAKFSFATPLPRGSLLQRAPLSPVNTV